jgi:hypothetical protein
MVPIAATKEQSRTVNEHEVIHSDRVPLAVQANLLVYSMVEKQTPQGSVATEIELSSQEQSAYDSALRFLERQFEKGSLDTESVPIRVETDDLIERQMPQ